MILPRLDDSPYDNPKSFADTWDETMTLIESALSNSGGGSGSSNDEWFYKTGRSILSPKPQLAGSPVLGIRLPVGFEWFQNGDKVTVGEEEVVGGVLANFDGYIVLEYDNGWDIVNSNADKSNLDSGSGILAHVVSNATGVVSIDSGSDDADIVYDMPSIAALLGGSGEGGSLVSFLEQLRYSTGDPRNAITVIEEKLGSNLTAALEAAESSGVQKGITENDQIWDWIIANRNILGIAAPSLLKMAMGGGAQPGLHGTVSAPDTEQFDVGGTLKAVPQDREYNSQK